MCCFVCTWTYMHARCTFAHMFRSIRRMNERTNKKKPWIEEEQKRKMRHNFFFAFCCLFVCCAWAWAQCSLCGIFVYFFSTSFHFHFIFHILHSSALAVYQLVLFCSFFELSLVVFQCDFVASIFQGLWNFPFCRRLINFIFSLYISKNMYNASSVQPISPEM